MSNTAKNIHIHDLCEARSLAATSLMLVWILFACSHLLAEPVTWQRHAIPLPESIWSVETVDANTDGRLDIIAVGPTQVFALTAPEWSHHLLADTKEVKMIYCVKLDADGDSDLDIALGRSQVPWIKYRQALAEGEDVDEPKGPDFSVAWIENSGRVDAPWQLHAVDRELNGVHGVWAGDINGDGLDDLIADSIYGPQFPESVAWFQSPLKKRETTPRHIVSHKGAGGRPHYLDFADLDGDGKGEILLGDSGDGLFTSWTQGDSPAQPWTRYVFSEEEGATNIKAASINGDGRVDVVAACGHGQGVFWFDNDNWKKHVVDSEIQSAHALDCGDFDDDGDIDVAAASYTECIVRWYENDGNGTFTIHDIDTDHEQQSYDLRAVDLDGDGRLDILLAGRESMNAVWYRNEK